MTTPTPIEFVQSGNATPETTATVSLQSGSSIAAGERLFMFFTCDGGPALTAPAGWTALDTQVGTTGVRSALYYLDASGGETTADVTLGTDQEWVATVVRFNAGVSDFATAPPENTQGSGSTGTSADPPSHTPSGGSDDYGWIPFVMYDDGSAAISGYPSSYTNNINNVNSGVGHGLAYRELTGSVEDPGAFTIDTSVNYRALTVSIPPDAASGHAHSKLHRASKLRGLVS